LDPGTGEAAGRAMRAHILAGNERRLKGTGGGLHKLEQP
jgi:hypothetical protein